MLKMSTFLLVGRRGTGKMCTATNGRILSSSLASRAPLPASGVNRLLSAALFLSPGNVCSLGGITHNFNPNSGIDKSFQFFCHNKWIIPDCKAGNTKNKWIFTWNFPKKASLLPPKKIYDSFKYPLPFWQVACMEISVPGIYFLVWSDNLNDMGLQQKRG